MSENDIFGELDDRTEEPNGGDYADWWEPEDEGDTLIGVVVELHSAPEDWTDAGEVPDTIYTVLSVGRGTVDEGVAVTPKQHKQLKRGLETANINDLVKIEFTGYDQVNGNMMMTYEVGVIPEDEWEEYPGSEDIEEVLENYSGREGDNRQTEPYTGVSDDPVDDGPDGESDDTELGNAASALREVLEIQNGSVDKDKAEEIINEIREFDVDIDEVILMAGLDVEDGVIQA